MRGRQRQVGKITRNTGGGTAICISSPRNVMMRNMTSVRECPLPSPDEADFAEVPFHWHTLEATTPLSFSESISFSCGSVSKISRHIHWYACESEQIFSTQNAPERPRCSRDAAKQHLNDRGLGYRIEYKLTTNHQRT